MGKVYDDWERLVEAVLRREKLRQLCYAHSVSSSDCSSVLDHDFLHHHAQMSMVRLQDDLIYTLTQNKQCFEHGYTSTPNFEEDPIYEESTALVNTSRRQSSSSESEECVVNLLDPDMIPQIKAIAEVFVGFGKGAFGVYLTILDVEELSPEDSMGPESWNSKIKKWRFAIKKFIVVYLCKAKLLFDHVLGEYGDRSSSCLIEASKPSLMWFFDFDRAVAVEQHQVERFFDLCDMYEDLVEHLPICGGFVSKWDGLLRSG